MSKVYRYKKASIGDDGNMVEEILTATMEELEEMYWQKWADTRILWQMPVNRQEFILDLKNILDLEEVSEEDL